MLAYEQLRGRPLRPHEPSFTLYVGSPLAQGGFPYLKIAKVYALVSRWNGSVALAKCVVEE